MTDASFSHPSGTESLTPDDLQRYRRHLALPEIGSHGQQRLKAASVLCVGAGGLGSPAALYLAAAGIGRLGLIDFDRVELSNLQRQVLHGMPDLGRLKVESAREALKRLNPRVDVEVYPVELGAANVAEIAASYDLLIDGADNFRTRYLINDACALQDKPYVYGGIFRFEGQVSLFQASQGPCYRCLYPAPPPPETAPSCAEGGVVGALPGIIGSIQAMEAIKWIVGAGESLQGRLLLVDALTMRFRELRLAKDPACPGCGALGGQPVVEEVSPRCEPTARVDAAASDAGVVDISPMALHQRLQAGDPLVVLDVREPFEAALGCIPGSVLIPLNELERRRSELDPARETVVYCHVGIRSVAAAWFLHQQGFPRVLNLAGGIHAWSRFVDPTLPVY